LIDRKSSQCAAKTAMMSAKQPAGTGHDVTGKHRLAMRCDHEFERI
jgi:hypothetical protein